MKKILSVLLCICFVLSFLNLTTFAAKKENLCTIFELDFALFPERTGEHILSPDFFWMRKDDINIKEGASFSEDIVVSYLIEKYAFEYDSKNFNEENNIYTVPEKEFEEFAKKRFDKFDVSKLKTVTYIDNSGNEVLRPTYYENGNYVFRGPMQSGGGDAWQINGYKELGNDKYEVYVCFAPPDEPVSDIIAKSVVTYKDEQIKFYSFEKTSSIPSGLITKDTVIGETESSGNSTSSDKSSSKESGTESKNPVSSSDGSTSKKPQTSNDSKKPDGNSSSENGNSAVSSEKKETSSKKPTSNASKPSYSGNTSSTASGEVSNGISVSLDSERNDSQENTSSKAVTDEIKIFTETENAKIEAKPSVFPENTTIEITSLSEGEIYEVVEKAIENKASKFKAFDITAKNGSVEVQPNGKVTLTLAIPDDFDLSLLEIWFISDNGEIEVIPSVVDSMTKTVTAELSHFSAYVMVENAVTEEISFSTDAKKEQNSEQKTGNSLVWIIIAVVVVLIIAGVCCWYFLFFKKKKA